MVQSNRGLARGFGSEIRGRSSGWGAGLGLVFFGTAFSSTAVADVLRVPSGFPTIQGCIDAALDGDQCIVAPGTYNELINFNGKAITLRSSGGPEVTIIDAEPVAETPPGKSVVRCVSGEGPDTVLDGFTITGGTGSTAGPVHFGGGMNNTNSSPTVVNCTFTRNSATFFGGGMYNENGNPNVVNCAFRENSVLGSGGGMHNDHASPTVTGCIFVGNSVGFGGYGGGIANRESSNVVVTNCVFAGNTAHVGGGIRAQSGSLFLTNCSFSGNKAIIGGALQIFANGGAVVTNCVFSENSADDEGGAVYGKPTLLHAPIVSVYSCVMWNNVPNQITDEGDAMTIVRYTDVQDGWPGIGNIEVNPLLVNAEGSDGISGTDDDDLRLSPGSPCIDAGQNGWLPSAVLTDLAGRPRFFDDRHTPDTGEGAAPIVDMGAYEFGSGACVDSGHFSVVLCHQPPDGLGRPKTISASVHEAFDHFAHGDVCGACSRSRKRR